MAHAVLLFVAMAFLTGAVISMIAVWLMAASLLRPPRMTDGKALYVLRRLTPADVGLPYETMNFVVRDERQQPLSITGWWIPNVSANGRCAVLLHGYADAKVGALAWAPMWHKLGFNLYIPDLRAHGESGGDTCAGGYFERHDIAQAIDQLRANRPEDLKQVTLFGISLGAAVALAVAALRADIAAVVLDSPFTDFASASMAHMRRLGLPGDIFQRPAVALAQWRSGADYGAAAPLQLLAGVSCPVMMVLPSADLYVTNQGRDQLVEVMSRRTSQGSPDDLWLAPDVAHLMALVALPAEYAERLATFCAAVSNRSVPSTIDAAV